MIGHVEANADGGASVLFACPGCGSAHAPRVSAGTGPAHPIWKWNGSVKRPTFTPSILVTWTRLEPHVDHVCHSYVTDGRIQFLGDCTHALAGQTVDLPEWSDG